MADLTRVFTSALAALLRSRAFSFVPIRLIWLLMFATGSHTLAAPGGYSDGGRDASRGTEQGGAGARNRAGPGHGTGRGRGTEQGGAGARNRAGPGTEEAR